MLISAQEERFIADHPSTFHKSLPRLPSTDDAYELESEDDAQSTPKAHPKPPPGSPSTPRIPGIVGSPSNSYPFFPTPHNSPSPASEAASVSTSILSSPTPTDSMLTSNTSSTATGDDVDSLQLLAGLRHKFQQTEQELYAELAHTSEKNLNDVRRSFVTAARGATKRLAAWEKKHSSETHAGTSAERFVVPEPEWWKDGCHAVPGGNVIVREDDWGSIIAFTLRCVDFVAQTCNRCCD